MAIRGPDEAAEAKAAAAANVEKVVEQMKQAVEQMKQAAEEVKKAAAEMKKAAAAVEKATEDVVLAAAEVENTYGIGEGEVFEVEKLVAKRVHEGKTQYKVRWVGYSETDDTWEDESNIIDAKEAIQNFEAKQHQQ